jgi:ribonuclease P protein component
MAGDGECRFTSSMRLKRRDDFRRLFRDGAVRKETCFTLHVLPQDTGPRLGIVISRRYGDAIERNRVKRRIREAFRRIARTLPAVDIVLRPERECGRLGVDELMQRLTVAVNKAVAREERR